MRKKWFDQKVNNSQGDWQSKIMCFQGGLPFKMQRVMDGMAQSATGAIAKTSELE
jgi:hypothetical protein